MGRRTGLTREELHNQALAIGSNLIAQHGIENFSMRQVAKQIGYTVGTLYNVFKNQDDFILQINAATLANLQAYITNRLNAKLRGINILHNIAISYYTFAKENYALWRALFEYSLTEHETLPHWYVQRIESLMLVAEHALGDFGLNKKQVQCTSRSLWASVHGICALSLAGKLALTKSSPAEDLIHELVDKYSIGLTSKHLGAVHV